MASGYNGEKSLRFSKNDWWFFVYPRLGWIVLIYPYCAHFHVQRSTTPMVPEALNSTIWFPSVDFESAMWDSGWHSIPYLDFLSMEFRSRHFVMSGSGIHMKLPTGGDSGNRLHKRNKLLSTRMIPLLVTVYLLRRSPKKAGRTNLTKDDFRDCFWDGDKIRLQILLGCIGSHLARLNSRRVQSVGHWA